MFCKNKLWKIALSPNQWKRKTLSNIYRLFHSQTVVVYQVISVAELLLLIAICKPSCMVAFINVGCRHFGFQVSVWCRCFVVVFKQCNLTVIVVVRERKSGPLLFRWLWFLILQKQNKRFVLFWNSGSEFKYLVPRGGHIPAFLAPFSKLFNFLLV